MIAKHLSFPRLTGKEHDILERSIFRKPTIAYNEYIGIYRENEFIGIQALNNKASDGNKNGVKNNE